MSFHEFCEVIATLNDDELFRIYDEYSVERGPYDKRTQAVGRELEDRDYDLHPLTSEDYREWAAASCGLDYIPYY